MYFKKFNSILYEFNINGQVVIKSVKDITKNVRLKTALLEKITIYDEYDICEGDTPEIISAKVYGSPEFHWVIMLCNDMYDYLEDFPLSQGAFEKYMTEKYGSLQGATHHYVNDAGFVVSSDAVGAIPVSNYQYEAELNESKRRIKIISPQTLSYVISQFNAAI